MEEEARSPSLTSAFLLSVPTFRHVQVYVLVSVERLTGSGRLEGGWTLGGAEGGIGCWREQGTFREIDRANGREGEVQSDIKSQRSAGDRKRGRQGEAGRRQKATHHNTVAHHDYRNGYHRHRFWQPPAGSIAINSGSGKRVERGWLKLLHLKLPRRRESV